MNTRKHRSQTVWPLSGLFVLIILLVGCTQAPVRPVLEKDPPVLAPAPTSIQGPEKVVELATSTPAAEQAPSTNLSKSTEPAWQQITPPGEPVITFELPVDWKHYGQDTNWSPDEGKTIIGLRWGWNRPGSEVEAGLLPEESVVLETATVMVNGNSTRRFQLQVMEHMKTPPPEGQQAPVRGYEVHYISVRADSSVMDFFAFAESEAALADLEPVMQHLLESVRFE